MLNSCPAENDERDSFYVHDRIRFQLYLLFASCIGKTRENNNKQPRFLVGILSEDRTQVPLTLLIVTDVKTRYIGFIDHVR